MKTPISIIGCGWLGFPLARYLIENGHSIKGSTGTKSKLDVLASEGIQPHLLKFSAEGISGDISACLDSCKTLILNIPPGLRKNPERNYMGMMQHALPYIEKSSVENILFVGTTSVYGDNESNPVISEASETSTSETAKKMVSVENLFQQNNNFKTTILRFGGLIGPDRHPAKFLSAKKNLKNPEAPVNLIVQQDCIAVIDCIIKEDLWGETLNAVYPLHPTREAYYTQACKQMNLPIPHFDHSQKSKGKIIASNKLVRLLDYQFQTPI